MKHGKIEFIYTERKPAAFDDRVQIFDLRFNTSGVRVATIGVYRDGWWSKKLTYKAQTVFHSPDTCHPIGAWCNSLSEAKEYLRQELTSIFRGPF